MISNYIIVIKPQTSCTFINFPSVNLNDVPADSFDTNSKKHRSIMSPELGKDQFSSPVNKIFQKQPRMFC